MSYTYGDLTQDMKHAALLLAGIAEFYDGRDRWSVSDLEYEIRYLQRHTDMGESVEV